MLVDVVCLTGICRVQRYPILIMEIYLIYAFICHFTLFFVKAVVYILTVITTVPVFTILIRIDISCMVVYVVDGRVCCIPLK